MVTDPEDVSLFPVPNVSVLAYVEADREEQTQEVVSTVTAPE